MISSPSSVSLPAGLAGSWIGGVGKDSSRHLMLTEDKSIQSFSWSLERTPVGDILHLSEQSYRRE